MREATALKLCSTGLDLRRIDPIRSALKEGVLKRVRRLTFGGNDAIAKAVMGAAKALGIAVRWGADWDRDGVPHERGETDLGHFELV